MSCGNQTFGMSRNHQTCGLQRRLRAGVVGLLTLASAIGPLGAKAQGKGMHIQLTIGGQAIKATLDDTATARDFAELLPLSLTLVDYASIERISDLPRRLTVADAPAGHTPRTGDLAYYAPWGNLAVFIDGGSHARGLIRLGRVDAALGALQQPGPFKVRIERVRD